ncbi:MAG: carboxypeptidase regulatory-like domain-containing protein [Planctomycetes bacterium]|nr:carboxypeptidase regulatory-like domain-containing protein [Planctomycetota bacterium]
MRGLISALVATLAACGDAHTSSSAHATVRGTTMDAQSGEPLAHVLLEGPGGASAQSDEHGRFVLEGLSVGAEGELRARAPGGRVGSVSLRKLAAGELEVVVHVR